jgi:hypothetical protein
MTMMARRFSWGAALLWLSACGDPPPGSTFFDRNIEPILQQSCAGNTSGCHAANAEDPYQFAAGNLDVTSYDNIQKRRDLLASFGAYQYPLLLIKAVEPGTLPLVYRDLLDATDDTLTLEIFHAGGANLSVDSDAFYTLLEWLDNGATENGLPAPTPPRSGQGDCTQAIPADFDPAPSQGHANFAEFRDRVQPVLQGCASGSCHGAPQSDFFITCGSSDDQVAFNFSQTWAFVSDPAEDSQVLRVPLAVAAGGGPHTGGDQFPDRDDSGFVALRDWAAKIGPIRFGDGIPGREFFANQVQPILLTRGCSFPACHSPAAANDLKLRSGSLGFFSAVALEKNYELFRNEFMALEYPDARRGRAVAKAVLPAVGGIAHRGGPVLEAPGAGVSDPASCPPTFNAATATAFCAIQEWLRIERQSLISAGEVAALDPGDTVSIVYVDRQASHVAGPLQFDTHQPGADLRVATSTLGAGQTLGAAGAGSSLLAGCAGVNPATADVSAPDVRRDGTTVAFAMRISPSDPWGIWTVNLDGSGCTRVTPAAPDVSGIKIHNFDPAWSPDGEWIVFASTRGASGPSVTRRLFLPQSDLWRMRADGSAAEQITYLTNSEVGPQFMREGRITMSAEKVSGTLYQVAGRRINWDKTDYHPLLAQRATSPYADGESAAATAPSIGYAQATDIREAANGDFLAVLSDPGARGGAGTLAIFNRSVGPFEQGRSDPGYVRALRIVDGAATGRVGSTSTGAYRGAFSLPDGQIMTSYAVGFSGDLATATQFDWDIVAVDARTGARTTLVGGPGAQVDAVLAVKHPARQLYQNRRQLVFGGSVDSSLGERGVIHFPDAPMVFTLLNSNLRRGRPVNSFRGATQLAVYEEAPAPAGTTSGNGAGGIFESRRLLGRAVLASDGSAKVSVPAGRGVVLELQDTAGGVVVNMGEEHQLGAGERTSMGVPEPLFDAVCGGCHGSVSGSELDVAVTPDALTGASQSASAGSSPVVVGD